VTERKFLQLAGVLRQAMETGAIPPGSPLRAGRVAEEHAVSVFVARVALRTLADEGRVTAVRGVGWQTTATEDPKEVNR
jgi:DNA-binding GntR family transcriptional regulator